MSFPQERLRRLRRTESLRNLVAETSLSPEKLILPLFVRSGEKIEQPVASMPGVAQLSIDRAIDAARKAESAGVGGVILFGIPSAKDEEGSEASDPDGIIPCALRALRENTSRLVLVADVCLCEYTSHGHCGVLNAKKEVRNDATLDPLAQAALAYAQAGADWVAPSDMMDGRIGVIRRALDANGFQETSILSYAAKYCSAFYGPFRDAAGSAPQFGDRRSYQMDPRNSREALREAELDLEEGADILMVKPALAYLDVIHEMRRRFQKPIAAYSVSGEFSMVESAAELGRIDRRKAILEILTSIRRAGADIILTYWASEVSDWL